MKAYEIVALNTLFKPFDGFVWVATCLLICVQTSLLIAIRKILLSLLSARDSRKLGNDHFSGNEYSMTLVLLKYGAMNKIY